jgi:hypothetical protein
MALPTLEILYPEGAAYLGFAQKKLRDISTFRIAHNIPNIKRMFIIDDTTITLFSSHFKNFIRIEGGILEPQILFVNADTGHGYNWTKNKLAIAAYVPTEGDLVQIFNGRCQIDDLVYSSYNKGWTAGVIGNAFKYIGGVNRYELALFDAGGAIYGRIGGDIIQVIPSVDLSEIISPFQSRDMFSFPVESTPQDNWNLVKSTSIYQWNPASGATSNTFRWIPAFGFAEPGNGMRVTGWYYGPVDDGFENLDAGGEAQLCCFMDCKETLDVYRFGYCEAVTRLDIEDVMTLVFFIDTDPPNISGDTFYSWRTSTIPAWADMRMGTSFDPPTSKFIIDDPFDDGAVPTVEMWTLAGWVDEETLLGPASTPDVAGIAISSGNKAIFYRYKGYLLPVYSSDNYHSHSVSTDGKILAVFEGTTIIERVLVFDLYSERGVEDDAPYERGGFTQLRDSEVVATASAFSGTIIPYRAEGYMQADFNLTAGSLDISDGLHDSAYASLFFNRRLIYGPVINKLEIKDGIYARVGSVTDECFESTIVLEEPGISSEKLVVTWGGDPVVEYTGFNMRGSFSGSLDEDNVRFNGEGAGDSYTLPPHFAGVNYGDGEFGFSGYSGELILTDGFDDEGESDQDLAAKGCDPPAYLYRAISSCGQTAEIADEQPLLQVSGAHMADIDTVYGVSGGVAPYVFSSPELTFTPVSTYQQQVASISACGAPGTARLTTITVTDFCGDAAELVVLLPDGMWSDTGALPASSNAVTLHDMCVISALYIGGLRVAGTVTCFDLTTDGIWLTPSSGSPISAALACPSGEAYCSARSPTLGGNWYTELDWKTLQVVEWVCP